MEIYNYMAIIIRILLERNFIADKAYAVADNNKERIEEDMEKLLRNNSFSLKLTTQQLIKMESIPLVILLQMLDKRAIEELKQRLWSDINFDNIYSAENGLNSMDNILETNIMVLPRYRCIWDGASREKHHMIDINTFLENSFFVEVSNAKVEGKYEVINHFLNPRYFELCYDEKSELYLKLAMSPLTKDITLKLDKFFDVEDGAPVNYFMIEELSMEEQDKLIDNINKVTQLSHQQNR